MIERLYRKYGDSVEFIGVNLGVKNEIDRFVESTHIGFPIVYDEGDKIAKAFGAQVQTNILINRSGIIVYDERAFREDMDDYLIKLMN